MSLYAILFVLLLGIELAYFKIADKLNIIDKPNQRSSHTRITLRGGGIIFFFGAMLYFLVNGGGFPFFMVGLTLITVISFIDDVHSSSRLVRLGIHLTAMLLMFYQWRLFTDFPWWYIGIALVCCIGIINAYNFMDGINGITGGYSLVLLSSFYYINEHVIRFTDSFFIGVMIMAVLVFNIFNFRTKAKCFAGDVGSVTIAFIILFFLGQLILQTEDLTYIILLAVYGVDSVLTIIHRMMLKENIFDAHRKHAYQLLANELGWKHVWVSGFYMVLQLAILVGYLALGETYHWTYLIAVIAVLSGAYVLFMKKYFKLHQA